MKNFKLMLIALMAMVCSAAFAQDKTDGKFKFAVLDGEKKTVVIKGFTTSVAASDKANIEIGNTIKDITDPKSPDYKVAKIGNKAFKDETAITKVTFKGTNLESIDAEAFSGCTALKTVDFTAATKLANISAGAFKGTVIETLDLSKTIVEDIYNLFGTSPKVAKVTYTNDDIDAANAETVEKLGFGALDNGDVLTNDQANAYNATLPGALKGGLDDEGEQIKFTAAQAAAYNEALLDGTKDAGDQLNADEAAAYNLKLEGAFDYTNDRYIDGGFFTAIGAAVYNTDIKGAEEEVATTETGLATKKANIDAWNANPENVEGALASGVDLTADDAAAYNAALDDAKEEGDDISVDMANLYNATLDDALAADDVLGTGDGQVSAEAFNKAVGFKAVGDEKYPAIAAVSNAKLQTVKLPATWTNFRNSWFNEGTVQAGVFQSCTALKTIDFGTPAEDVEEQNLSEYAFAGTALESVAIPATISYIPEYAFYDCEKLATVTFAHKSTDDATDAFNGIGEKAFSATALKSIAIPNWLTVNPEAIADKAFADCGKLTTISYAPAEADANVATISLTAFAGCNDFVTLVTNSYLKDAYTTAGDDFVPQHMKISTDGSAAPEPVEEALKLEGVTKYKSADKYYVKYVNDTEKTVRIEKKGNRVYAAYLNDGNNTLDMIKFKIKNDLYLIKPGDVVLILSDNEEITYTTQTVEESTSWVTAIGNLAPTTAPDAAHLGDYNQLRMTTEKTMKSSFEDGAKIAGAAVATYAWVNSASGVGFQKLGLTSVPAGVMYVYAKEPADGARLIVRWLDENGNVEDEATAIRSIATESESNDAMYNVAGQKVNASYKGLVIKDGKKYMKK